MKKLLLYSVLFLTFACTYTQKINSGDMAFERKQFAVAVNMLPEEYKKEKSTVNRGKIAYKLGESYNRMNQNEKEIEWYKTAYDNSYGIDALKGYAFALKKAGRYKEAKLAFKELGIEIGSPYEYRKEISACDIAQGWIDNQDLNPYKIKDAGLNSADADYAPVILKDGQVLFTSDRKLGKEDEETYNWTGNSFSNLLTFNARSFETTPYSEVINTVNNEGTATFNQDFTTIIFTRCFAPDKGDRYCKLMSSTLEDDEWTEPTMLNFTKPEVNYGHPSLSKDGNTLYFSSNDPEGWGGYDIYLSQRNNENKWTEPKLLSRAINTEKDDSFPYIDADTLYFASEGHTGMGGLDIFSSYIQNGTRWTPAQNMLPPINSPADDFGIAIDYTNPLEGDDLQQGYFTSSRANGLGNDDIYKFTKIVLPPVEVVEVDTVETKPEEIEYKLILNGYVVEQIFKDPNNPNSQVIGRRPIPSALVDVNVGGQSIDKITVDKNGFFSIVLDEETDYYLFGSKDGYLNNSNRFSSKGIGKDPRNPTQEFEVEIVLDKIFKNQEIVLDNIYYDLDKWDIRPDAEPTLNALYNTLQQNPTISIQLNSHTDCQGQDQYNQNLSQKRAQSAIEYLIKQGIDASRLSAVGYGETRLAIDCVCAKCTDEEHQANRRTTFTIVE